MADYWQPTLQMFSSLFEKPKMAQKLLEKPPFKYLFDIIAETTKVTGYAKGLYTAEESDAAYHDSKERKIAYLSKIIQLTQLMLKEEIQAKPQKIVSGLEPELTNLMLQAIYRAAVSGKSSDPFVKKLNGGAADPPKQEEKKVADKPKADPKPEPKVEPKPEPKQEPKAAPVREEKKPQPKAAEPKVEQKQPVQEATSNANIRPSTAKKRPPQLPANQVTETGGPKKAQGTANVIIDGKFDEQDDDTITMATQNRNVDINPQEHGKFVKDAYKQNQQAQAQGDGDKNASKPEEGGIRMQKIGKPKKNSNVRQQVAQDMGASIVSDTVLMQKLIQQICQNANPLGKQLEFIQDDIESMNYELQQWRKIYNSSKQKMGDMSRATDEACQPLFDKIAEVEEGVRDKKTKIQHLKAQIIKNKQQVDQLLKSVLVQK